MNFWGSKFSHEERVRFLKDCSSKLKVTHLAKYALSIGYYRWDSYFLLGDTNTIWHLAARCPSDTDFNGIMKQLANLIQTNEAGKLELLKTSSLQSENYLALLLKYI